MAEERMKAAVLYGKEDIRIEQIPIPPVGVGEVRVRVAAATTCGTDVKVFRRGYHAKMIQPPVPFGHEFSGIIDFVGESVDRWKVGDYVVAGNSAACGECYYCGLERPELCEDLLFLNGAYAEYITIPERIVKKNLWEVPEHLPYEFAALTEPLACVAYGFDETDIQVTDTVAVIGVGPIGLFFIQMLRKVGIYVIAVGRGPERIKVAEALGATRTISVLEETDIVAKVKRMSRSGHGPDVVIECVGLPSTWEMAIAMVRKGGKVNLFGGCPKDTTISIDTGRIHYDEVRLMGTFHHTPAKVKQALDLLAHGVVDCEQFIQNRITLDELPDAIKKLAQNGGAVKTAVMMGIDF